jgi:non-canonical poly(A) RNA polymerase PAPD5/7
VDGIERERQQKNKRVRSPEPTPSKRYSPWRDIEGGDASVSYDPDRALHGDDYDREESGKYDIERQVPRKRRRKGKEEDQHTVFIDVSSGSDQEVVKTKGREFGKGLKNDGGERLSSEVREKRRNYWLSKASGVEEDDSD